ncbi:hypothetical protein [Tropicibacter sp. S64]|uniref:hypothetical protein n=1 Tax=Tropicibacter sp. S64 TaxID=3415122 RepID=UPI003C7AE97D
MPITYIGEVAAAGAGSSADVSGLGLQEGDVLLCAWFCASNADRGLTISTGMDEKAEHLISDGLVDTSGAVGYLTVGATAPGTIEFGGNIVTGSSTAFLVRAYRNVAAVSFDTATAGGNNPIRPAPVTVAEDGSLVVIMAGLTHQTGIGTLSNTDMVRETQRAQNSTYDLVGYLGEVTRDAGAFQPADFVAEIINPKTWILCTVELSPQPDEPAPEPVATSGLVGAAGPRRVSGEAGRHNIAGSAGPIVLEE